MILSSETLSQTVGAFASVVNNTQMQCIYFQPLNKKLCLCKVQVLKVIGWNLIISQVTSSNKPFRVTVANYCGLPNITFWCIFQPMSV